VTDRYVYDAFGRTIQQMGSTVNSYLFAGEQRDGNIGLDYLRARYLHVGTGRFFGRDSFPGSLYSPQTHHRYLYVTGNPTNSVDPTGRFDISFGLSEIADAAINVFTHWNDGNANTLDSIKVFRIIEELSQHSDFVRFANDFDYQQFGTQ